MEELRPALPVLPQRAFCTRLGEDTAPELQRAERLGWFINTVIVHNPDAEAGPGGGWRIDNCVRYCFVQKPREVAYVWELLKRFWVPTPSWVSVEDIERSLDPNTINEHLIVAQRVLSLETTKISGGPNRFDPSSWDGYSPDLTVAPGAEDCPGTEQQPLRVYPKVPRTVGDLVDKLWLFRRDLPLKFVTTHGHRLEWSGMGGTDEMELSFDHEKEALAEEPEQG